MPLSPQATAFYLEIGGVDRTEFLRRGTVQVNMRLNMRWDASFELFDSEGTLAAQEGKNVLLKELPLAGGEERTFYGKLDDIEQIRAVDNTLGTQLFYKCKCVDLMSRLDQRVCSEWSVHKNVTAGYIVYFALNNFAWSEGITFSPAASPGGFIEEGANVEKFVVNKQTVLEVIEEMCKLSDKVAFVDVNGDFHFEDAGATMPAPFSISATSANFSRISLRRSKGEGAGSSGAGYYNQSWTRTSWAAWEQRYDVFTGAGPWDLALAAAVVVDIKVNSKSVDFGGEEEGRAYTWKYGETVIEPGPGEPALTDADTIEVWSHSMDQGFIFVQDLTEITARGGIEDNTGQCARIFDDSQETNFQQATDKAQARLDISKTIVDVVTLEAYGYGSSPIFPRPGMVFSAALSYPSINGDFTILEVSAQEIAGAGLKYSCKCVTKASSRRLANGIDYFRELAKKKPGTTIAGGAGDGGPKTSPLTYRFLVRDTTVGDNVGDNISVYGALIGQASRVRRIVGTLRQAIDSELTVRFRVVYQSSPLTEYTIAECTIPAATAVDTSVVFTTFTHDVLPDLSVLIPDVLASDGSQAEDGVAAFVIETIGRGNELPAVDGVGWMSTWDSGTTYDLNDVVHYNGASYISLHDSNTNHTPGSSPTWWDLVADSGGPGVIQENGTTIGTRETLNFIAGENVSLDVVDDAVNDRVNITITAVGAGSSSGGGSSSSLVGTGGWTVASSGGAAFVW